MIPIPVIRTSMLLLNFVNQLLVSNLTKTPKVLVINYGETFKIPITHYDLRKGNLPFTTENPDIYIVNTELTNWNDTLEYLEKRIIFNPKASFIFVTNSLNEHYFFKYFVETCMDEMIVIENTSKTQLTILKYKTHREGRSNISMTVNIEYCIFFEEMLRCNNTLSKDMTVSSLKVGLSYNPPSVVLKDENTTEGIDVDVLKIITKKLNLTMDLYTVEEFAGMWNDEHFSFNGALGSLERKEVDLVVGGLFPRRDSYLSFKHTRPTTVNRYVWIVPAAKMRPFWKRILFTYSVSVWILLAITFLTALLVLSLSNGLTMEGNYYIGTELLKLYSMCLTAVKVKQTELWPKKLLCISWYLFLITFLNFFTARLLSNLVVKRYEYQVHSKNELLHLNWEICMFSDLAEYISSFANKTIITCNNCEKCANKTASEGHLVSIRSENVMAFDMRRRRLFLDEDGEALVFFLDEYFLVTYDIFIFRRNHPVYRRFNELLYVLADSGLYEKISSKYTPKKPSKPKIAWRGLAYNQLSFIFEFVMFALISIIFVFILEVNLKSR